MEAMIQPVNSSTINPASHPAESLLHPAESFKEVLRKQSAIEEKKKDMEPRAKSLGQAEQSFKKVLHKQASDPEKKGHGVRAKGPRQAAQSSQEVLQKQSGAEEKNKDEDPEPGAEELLQTAQSSKELQERQPVGEEENTELKPGEVAAAILSDLLPILPNLAGQNNFALPGIAENPEENIPPFPGAPTKSDSSALTPSIRPDSANILNAQDNEIPADLLSEIVQLHSGETSDDLTIDWKEGKASLLGKIPIPSQFPEGAIQTKGAFPKAELHPGLFRKQTETAITSFAELLDELPEGQKKPMVFAETAFQHSPWALENESLNNHTLNAEYHANLFGPKTALPGLPTDSTVPAPFDENFNFLLGQKATVGELPGQALSAAFIEAGNPAEEKSGAKVPSGGENQPTPEPSGVNEVFGSVKPSSVVNDPNISPRPALSKSEPPDLYSQIAEKIVWSIRNNQERIRLTLEPPQLGNLFIELHRNREEIKATLWADNPKTKEILENNQFQLQKTLEGHGFKLEQYDVFVQQDMGSFQGREENPVFQGQGGRTQSPPVEEAELNPSLETLPGVIPATGASQYIDRFI